MSMLSTHSSDSRHPQSNLVLASTPSTRMPASLNLQTTPSNSGSSLGQQPDNSADDAVNDEDEVTSPIPPVPPRLSRSKLSFEKQGASFEENVLPSMKGSVSSDTGLYMIAKSTTVFEPTPEVNKEADDSLGLDGNIPTDDLESKHTSNAANSIESASKNAAPMLHRIDTLRVQIPPASPFSTHRSRHAPAREPPLPPSATSDEEEYVDPDFDSLDVIIPPVEDTRKPAKSTSQNKHLSVTSGTTQNDQARKKLPNSAACTNSWRGTVRF